MDALDLIRDFFGGLSGCEKCRKVWGKYKPTCPTHKKGCPTVKAKCSEVFGLWCYTDEIIEVPVYCAKQWGCSDFPENTSSEQTENISQIDF